MPTSRDTIPKAVLVVLLTLWMLCGLWIVGNAPFDSGTDESINYVAFAAAKNRWATEEDFRRYGLDYYYPPLYFLVFAPLWGDEPSFVEDYPKGDRQDRNYYNTAGRRVVSAGYQSRVPPPLRRLYRQAKLFSLGLGLIVLLAVLGTVRLLFPGPTGWWAVLLGTAPLIFLPQFLYYHTLVNNDTLVNALGALASLAFTAALLALERGLERRFLALGLAAAACIGLAFLTKMSAPVLLPLALGLMWARLRVDRGLAWGPRARRALLLLAQLAVVLVVSGGWWVAHMARQGDWSSFKAHRLAHPWAVVDPASLADPAGWAESILLIVRSYYALFSGGLFIGVPDAVFLAWLIMPLALLGCGVAVAAGRIRSRKCTDSVGPGPSLRGIVWMTFAGVFLFNGVSVLVNLCFFQAFYGRLLFPSLVATHAMAAACVVAALRGRRRALVSATTALVLYAGLLFGWTFRQRMVAAVTQPPEDVRVLTGIATGKQIGPLWASRVRQYLWIPPGELAALRVNILRKTLMPQIGASLEGVLKFRSADGKRESIAVRRIALGDNDLSVAWAELELERTVRFTEITEALLVLRGSPPEWFPGTIQFNYLCCDKGRPLRWDDGTAAQCALCVAAVYRQ